MADVPGSSGLGSSSSFTIGLIKLLAHWTNTEFSLEEVVKLAVHVERNVLGEAGGVQDQLHSAYGGISFYEFENNSWRRNDLSNNSFARALFSDFMVLAYTEKLRSAAGVQTNLVSGVKNKRNVQELRELADLAREVFGIIRGALSSADKLKEISHRLNESWKLKRISNPHASTEKIDGIIKLGIACGASSAKVLGAGGGGFVGFLVEPGTRTNLEAALKRNGIKCISVRPIYYNSEVISI